MTPTCEALRSSGLLRRTFLGCIVAGMGLGGAQFFNGNTKSHVSALSGVGSEQHPLVAIKECSSVKSVTLADLFTEYRQNASPAAPVPEPQSYGCLGIGVVLLTLVLKRRLH